MAFNVLFIYIQNIQKGFLIIVIKVICFFDQKSAVDGLIQLIFMLKVCFVLKDLFRCCFCKRVALEAI